MKYQLFQIAGINRILSKKNSRTAYAVRDERMDSG